MQCGLTKFTNLSNRWLSIELRHIYRPTLPTSSLTFTITLPCRIMPLRRLTRVNRGTPAQSGGRTGGRGGRGSGRGTGNNNNNNENPDFETIIARQLQGLLPTIVTQVGDHMSHQGNNVSRNDHGDNDDGNDHANDGNHTNGNKGCTYREFSASKPVDFDSNGGAIAYTRWVEKMESVIDISECADHQKIKYAACSLTGKALAWWNTQIQARGREAARE
ncbi:reverse transcriptase domain-containing protein [Artemisia annua]|uniref:Reverse transcriptase domain-containing protein n=1 Tax=Artemisia annua TaxID=35608 RepID=A0A2U1NEU4_ARTAN|nr:reverse transcriptase domain-containing protein [Artemisia annua]